MRLRSTVALVALLAVLVLGAFPAASTPQNDTTAQAEAEPAQAEETSPPRRPSTAPT